MQSMLRREAKSTRTMTSLSIRPGSSSQLFPVVGSGGGLVGTGVVVTQNNLACGASAPAMMDVHARSCQKLSADVCSDCRTTTHRHLRSWAATPVRSCAYVSFDKCSLSGKARSWRPWLKLMTFHREGSGPSQPLTQRLPQFALSLLPGAWTTSHFATALFDATPATQALA